MRAFVDAEVTPNCDAWDRVKAIPRELFAKAFAAGLLPGVVGPPWPVAYAGAAPEVRAGQKSGQPVRALTRTPRLRCCARRVRALTPSTSSS